MRALPLFAVMCFAFGCATAPPPVVRAPPRPPAPDPAPPVARPVPPPPVARPAPPAVPSPAVPFRTVVAVQTCLDRNNFSCGVIDGELHARMTAALKAWQGSRGLPVTGALDAATLARVGNLDAEFTRHIVSQEEWDALTDFPASWSEKAARSRLGYTTIQEAVAEQYHLAQQTLRDLNPGVPWPNPPVGTELVVPKCLPGRHVDAARLEISLSRKELKAYDAEGRLVALFPCSIARDVSKRPVGELRVVNAASNPNYTFDPALFAGESDAEGISRKLLIPPGPNNPVGLAWIGLDRPGYGIHGTPHPEDIGKTESHGCFRLANWNAQKLVKMVRIGTPVRVDE